MRICSDLTRGCLLSEWWYRRYHSNGWNRCASSHGRDFYSEIGHKGGEKGGQRVRELIEEGKESEGEQ